MKLLYLAHRIPYPPNKGDKIRSYHQVKYLGERHEVDLACLCDGELEGEHVDALRGICRSVCVVPMRAARAKLRSLGHALAGNCFSSGYFYESRLQRHVDRWLQAETYDAVLCFSSPMAEYLFRSRQADALWRSPSRPRRVMDFCDLDSDKWAQYAQESPLPWRVVYGLEARRLLAYEAQIHREFDASVFISRSEVDLFRRKIGSEQRLHVVGNGVDTDYFVPKPGNGNHAEDTRSVVFVGAMDYYANVDGVLWFVKDVWPRVRGALPDATFVIVGSRPEARIRRLDGRDGVRVTGFVPDVRPYLARAGCVVAPLRLARGVQNKVLEAMAMGKAVVATPQALQGIEARSGQDLLCAKASQEFAEAIQKILTGESFRSRMEKRARNYILLNHSWLREMEKLESIIYGANSLEY